MGARVIDGRGLAAELKEELTAEVAGLRDAGVLPGLATVLVGSPAEAAVYERRVRSLETANTGGIVRTDTISVGSVRGKGSSDD
jgi:methylenetetrahydrofolate dehydrogenase (NADP+) / methenyltetrahydrofolate cyclohydrolase